MSVVVFGAVTQQALRRGGGYHYCYSQLDSECPEIRAVSALLTLQLYSQVCQEYIYSINQCRNAWTAMWG